MREDRVHKRTRFLYSWSGGSLDKVGSVPEARLRAWEYEVASDTSFPAGGDIDDTVRLWRTRRPDLAPAELWVGDAEVEEPV
jgi:hypothetical protein